MPMPIVSSLTFTDSVRPGSTAAAKGRWTSPSGISVGGTALASSPISGTTWVRAASVGSPSCAKAAVPAMFALLSARAVASATTSARADLRMDVLPRAVGGVHKRRKRKDRRLPFG
ncbi:hypothetical protein [Nonomuraea candida]|uniref:hypothetical protein n=1 Tax=Nonomuraea candida TaxID=359159 RepID=UPI0012F9012F|nr:hypothetical protein [Nonomuraea candida]